ncbi:MAG: type I-E CRISPR-associated protein Cse1/CasA [Candidatus Latescibacterota bacterium]
MNLIGDPWIPVLDGDGRARLLGLGEVYGRGEDIRDLALPPLQRIGVMRLLLCITHAALDGPQDEDDWRACRPRIGPASLAYLRQRHERFELYGQHPFLQVGGLKPLDGKELQNAPLDKLDFGLAAGDNDTLYDHAANGEPRVHPPAWQALNLLVMQLFAQSSSRITRACWGGRVTPGSPKHAPAAVESALHAFLRAGNLLDSLHLNLVTREDVVAPWGKPVWDVEIPHHESPEATDVRESFLGRLVPLARGILLRPGSAEFTLVAGLEYERPPDGRETMATVVLKPRKGKMELGYLGVNLSRHPWRDVESVLALSGAGAAGGPLSLRHLLRDPDLGTVDVWLGGLRLEKSAKVVDTAEWVFTVPNGLLAEDAMATYRAGVELAEDGETRVCAAVAKWAGTLQVGKDQLPGYRSRVVRSYWSALDARCGVLVEAACSAGADLAPWRKVVSASMHRAYKAGCAHTTPRQIQAFARGRPPALSRG